MKSKALTAVVVHGNIMSTCQCSAQRIVSKCVEIWGLDQVRLIWIVGDHTINHREKVFGCVWCNLDIQVFFDLFETLGTLCLFIWESFGK